jgi:hypothetical protein
VVIGCGGSSSSTSDTEGDTSFLNARGNDKIPQFGEEASEEEQEAASSVLEENLKARANGDWEGQCSSLTLNTAKKAIEEFKFFGNNSCARSLEATAIPVDETQPMRAYTMTGPIDAMRIKGERGFALYHGTKGKDYAMPMEKKHGKWKVAALAPMELP